MGQTLTLRPEVLGLFFPMAGSCSRTLAYALKVTGDGGTWCGAHHHPTVDPSR